MTLLSLDSIGLSYGLPPLLEGVSFAIERGERICLIGRNGAGKSTLLRIIAGELQPDSGRIHLSQGLRIGYLAQDLPAGSAASVFEVVVSGLGELGALVRGISTARTRWGRMRADLSLPDWPSSSIDWKNKADGRSNNAPSVSSRGSGWTPRRGLIRSRAGCSGG